MFIGHSQLVKDFKELARRGKLAHGYIFFGEPEVGKFYFAKHLANFLETGEFSISSRPLQDLMVIDSTKNLKTDAIGIESVRLIKNFVYKKPAVSSKRTLVIDNADNLTDKAQAAILKITEEPPENAFLILILNNPDVLLPTILSRMQKIYFGRLSNSEMENVIQSSHKATADKARDKKIIDLAWGRPGRAIHLLSDSITKKAESYAEKFLKLQGYARSKLIKEFIEEQKELSEEKEGSGELLLDRFFESLILKLRGNLINNAGTLKSALHRLFLIKSYNVNKRIQLEAL
ncbi:MAG: hypothetical protein A3I89_02455 [Candidatus Harrisonbacteria bacterium RIFCSPLOWO2_02_FULL_41_11]|uniref:AAA+ ATPase domain-containing protein n=1 Tax=Candidatus Harrisonbacteria bacterium RIFCSPHIGHO2_02_FULL_42_16 TaxID=1798404 RepID=A0A1G1ZL33_9BACT|nr:MAG: hypothetical protein A3B92_00170 [Candidatus Harrisonbacteria bacterium RIFCSPHIGHO2_02_FULL_42_16]OGY66526.1 MAG: hypothetical protein A3I89_02455 [Candidatus Harrisonbacteria bacterium RIFCSPLOWO2_02_FULL_41_11]